MSCMFACVRVLHLWHLSLPLQIKFGTTNTNSNNRRFVFFFFVLRLFNRPSVQFKLLPTNYEYPVAKPKHPSYEWTHPKGILKRNWMRKHLHVLPAVIVLFQDIEWNDPQWTEKQYQCASLMQSLKASLQVPPLIRQYKPTKSGSFYIQFVCFCRVAKPKWSSCLCKETHHGRRAMIKWPPSEQPIWPAFVISIRN